MWIRFLSCILGLVLVNASSQPATITPIAGCIQYRIDFVSTAIDENCLFIDQLDQEAVVGSSFARGQCDEKGGIWVAGYATTLTQQCPDNGYYYTGCCTADNCEDKVAIAEAYCDAIGMMTLSFCDNGNFYNGGCFSGLDPQPYSPLSASSNATDATRDQLNFQAVLNELSDLKENSYTTASEMVRLRQDINMQLGQTNEILDGGFTGVIQLGQMQVQSLRNIENQTIKARFEQSGLLANLELIGEEQLASLDSLRMNGVTVDNQAVIDAINDNHDQLMNATGSGGEEFEGVSDYDTSFSPDTFNLGQYESYYYDSSQEIIEGALDIMLPNYDSLNQNILRAFQRFQDNEVCPFQSIQVANWVNNGADFEVELGICEMTLIGNITVLGFLRTLINLSVYIGCAWIIHRTLIRALSGKDVN